jgi:hypothetical protein
MSNIRNISQFLTKEQMRSNRNFGNTPDGSNPRKVFDRTSFRYGKEGLFSKKLFEPTEGSIRHLESIPKSLRDWQADEMRYGTVGSYFKNPTKEAISFFLNVALKETLGVTVGPELDGEVFLYWDLIFEIFEYHTDRLSNVIGIEVPPPFLDDLAEAAENAAAPEMAAFYSLFLSTAVNNLPHYLNALPIGRQLLYIVNQTDGIKDNSPILGSFTSLFCIYDIAYELIELAEELIKNGLLEKNSTEAQLLAQEYNDKVVVAIFGSIIPDINFFKNSKNIVSENLIFQQMNEGGVTQKSLIGELVGSNKLKQKWSIPDNPNPERKEVNFFISGNKEIKNIDNGTITNPNINKDRDPISGILLTASLLPLVDVVKNDTYILQDTGDRYVWNGTKWVNVSRITGDTSLSGTLTSSDELTTTNNEIGDYFVIVSDDEDRTPTETYVWDGNKWEEIGGEKPKDPNDILDEFIEENSNTTTNTTFSVYTLEITPKTLIFDSEIGVWSNNKIVTIKNTGNSNYSFSQITTSGFINSEIRYETDPVNSNTVNVGNSINVIFSAKSLLEDLTSDYGTILIDTDIEIPTKINVTKKVTEGILLPSAVSVNVGSSTNRLPINVERGPFPLSTFDSSTTTGYTWINLSELPVTISTIEDITPSSHNTHMTITFSQANTPNTLNKDDSILWYANVTPHVEFPDSFVYKITTQDGQERLLTIGIDRGNVDDRSLYNEVINTDPDFVVTNSDFDIRVFNGKPNTEVSFLGPNESGVFTLNANGQYIIPNNNIEANGVYTFIFDFVGTGNRRTITKAIFAS